MVRMTQPVSVSENLVRKALACANGANIHKLKQLITIYRWCLVERPDIVKPFEDSLRAFVMTGRLNIPSVSF